MTHYGRLGTLLIASTLAASTLAGCGSVVTYSRISREQGIADLNVGKYAEAEGAFADAIRQNPRDYVSHFYLGTLYDRQKQYANALAHFKTSLDVQPLTGAGQNDDAFRVGTLTAQADTMAKVPDNDRSVNALEAKAGESKTGEENYQLARIFAGRGDADSAVVAYDRAAGQAPGRFYIAKAQGLYLNRQGMKADAEKALRRAYGLRDSDAEVAAALRGLGVVPGPSLKSADALSRPVLPVGPLPDLINRNRTPLPAGEVPGDIKD